MLPRVNNINKLEDEREVEQKVWKIVAKVNMRWWQREAMDPVGYEKRIEKHIL
jgi:hypothetical protein